LASSTGAAVAVAIAAVTSFGCGGAGTGTSLRRHTATTRAARQGGQVQKLVAKLEPYRLPTGVSGEAVTKHAGEILSLGGLDTLDTSTNEIIVISPGLRPRRVGMLSEAKHDLAAVELAGRTLVLGGGAAIELDTVEALSAQNEGTRVGTLPSVRSDLSAVTVGSASYVLGGYDGTEPLADVLRTTDARHYTIIGRLPVSFRYAAAAVFGARIYTFGGELASGEDTSVIQQIDTRTGATRVIGHLPRPVSHASAVVLGSKAYVLGGRSHGVALRRIVAFDPATAIAHPAGRLPFAVTNAAAVESGPTGYLIGGIGSVEQTLDTVIAVQLAH
jgi:Kelch motif